MKEGSETRDQRYKSSHILATQVSLFPTDADQLPKHGSPLPEYGSSLATANCLGGAVLIKGLFIYALDS